MNIPATKTRPLVVEQSGQCARALKGLFHRQKGPLGATNSTASNLRRNSGIKFHFYDSFTSPKKSNDPLHD